MIRSLCSVWGGSLLFTADRRSGLRLILLRRQEEHSAELARDTERFVHRRAPNDKFELRRNGAKAHWI
jgi:hypothetical protein